jgi:hypothetical protein
MPNVAFFPLQGAGKGSAYLRQSSTAKACSNSCSSSSLSSRDLLDLDGGFERVWRLSSSLEGSENQKEERKSALERPSF